MEFKSYTLEETNEMDANMDEARLESTLIDACRLYLETHTSEDLMNVIKELA